ncbi:hypothetical protein [Novosphingobium sp. MD-1]|uniref:hypothetical protein n=1 Tax=Novosphingobium sp. MD-1 TaxID=1630648 RepID=UPI000F7E600D|nr:hypothetical protein [Novosphingobium sp. MD-1]
MTMRLRLLSIAFGAISVPAVGQEANQSFCQHLAPQIRLHPVPADPKSGAVVWKTDTASVGMHLFGGAAITRVSVSPLDKTNAAEFVRLEKACDITPKGATCHLEGPATFEIKTRRFEASVTMAAGERADVDVRNTVILCRDDPH